MKVRELITKLLDEDMEAPVVIKIGSFTDSYHSNVKVIGKDTTIRDRRDPSLVSCVVITA